MKKRHSLPSVLCVLTLGTITLGGCDWGLSGNICLEGAGYVDGVKAPSQNDDATDQPELHGTHPMVLPTSVAAGAKEGLLVTVPSQFLQDKASDLSLIGQGAVQFVEPIDKQCDREIDSEIKGRFQATMAEGSGAIELKAGDEVVAEFPISVIAATSLDVFPPDPIVVGEPARICAVARSATGAALYADDSLAMSATGATLSLFDPGSACHKLTASAPGPISITATGLGLSKTIQVDAVPAN
jgi:hypothetical protein